MKLPSPCTDKSNKRSIITPRKLNADCTTTCIDVIVQPHSDRIPSPISYNHSSPATNLSPTSSENNNQDWTSLCNEICNSGRKVRCRTRRTSEIHPRNVESRLADFIHCDADPDQSHDEELLNHRKPSRSSSRYGSEDDGIVAPPNSRKSSQVPSRSSSRPATQPSSPHELAEQSEAWILPSDMRATSIIHQRDTNNSNSNLTRALSNEGFEWGSQNKHRGSMNSTRAPVMDVQNGISFLTVQDSVVLTKTKWDKRHRLGKAVQPSFNRLPVGGLSPIIDASPPDIRQIRKAEDDNSNHYDSTKLSAATIANFGATSFGIAGHSVNDHDCPICSIDRPRTKLHVI